MAARAAPPGPGPGRVVDVLLDALTLRFTAGYAAAAPTLVQASELILTAHDGFGEAEGWNWHPGALIALEMWDFESWQAIAGGQVQRARKTGALVHLQFALTYLARTHLVAGELATAARLIEEDQLIVQATGNPPFSYSAMMLAAWRGQETQATELIQAAKAALGGFRSTAKALTLTWATFGLDHFCRSLTCGLAASDR